MKALVAFAEEFAKQPPRKRVEHHAAPPTIPFPG